MMNIGHEMIADCFAVLSRQSDVMIRLLRVDEGIWMLDGGW